MRSETLFSLYTYNTYTTSRPPSIKDNLLKVNEVTLGDVMMYYSTA